MWWGDLFENGPKLGLHAYYGLCCIHSLRFSAEETFRGPKEDKSSSHSPTLQQHVMCDQKEAGEKRSWPLTAYIGWDHSARTTSSRLELQFGKFRLWENQPLSKFRVSVLVQARYADYSGDASRRVTLNLHEKILAECVATFPYSRQHCTNTNRRYTGRYKHHKSSQYQRHRSNIHRHTVNHLSTWHANALTLGKSQHMISYSSNLLNAPSQACSVRQRCDLKTCWPRPWLFRTTD